MGHLHARFREELPATVKVVHLGVDEHPIHIKDDGLEGERPGHSVAVPFLVHSHISPSLRLRHPRAGALDLTEKRTQPLPAR